jgi:recombination protein RecA
MPQAAVVDQLREKIRKLEAQPRQWVMALRTGWPELDACGAFRLGTGVELCGEEASGRTSIALSLVAAAGREKRLSAWVDGPHELYPPAAVGLGVDLRRLLIARPKLSSQVVWAAMQLLRSGAFTCVVLDVTHTGLRLTMTDTKKLLDAARRGGGLLVVLTGHEAPGQGFSRLTMKSRGRPRAVQLVSTHQNADASSCAPSFEVHAPHGREALVPCRPHHARRLQQVWAAPPWVAVTGGTSLQRPKKNTMRDGYPMGWGRPGRDTPLKLPLTPARGGAR